MIKKLKLSKLILLLTIITLPCIVVYCTWDKWYIDVNVIQLKK